jgi:hypothetical protein
MGQAVSGRGDAVAESEPQSELYRVTESVAHFDGRSVTIAERKPESECDPFAVAVRIAFGLGVAFCLTICITLGIAVYVALTVG